VQEQLVEEERVAGLEDRPQDRHVAGGRVRLAPGQLHVQHRPVLDHDLVEPARDYVEARCLVAAARQREPQVDRARAAHECTVLVP